MEGGSFVDLCLYATVLGTKGWADGGERPEGVSRVKKIWGRYMYATVMGTEGWADGGERPEWVLRVKKSWGRYRYVMVLDAEGWAESEGGRRW